MKNAGLVLLLLVQPNVSYGFAGYVWNYIKQYQVGIELSGSSDTVHLSYQTPYDATHSPYCSQDPANSQKDICSHSILAGQSSGFSLFLQQAFRRRGTFHFNYDLSLGARYLKGNLEDEELARLASSNIPLTEASLALGVVVAKPYIELGYTPSSRFPDILLRLGPVFQLGVGTVSINEQSETVAMALSSGLTGYFELEFVFWRFGDGALSLYSSRDSAGNSNGIPIYPNDIDGMESFEGRVSRSIGGQFFSYGLKLVLNWP